MIRINMEKKPNRIAKSANGFKPSHGGFLSRASLAHRGIRPVKKSRLADLRLLENQLLRLVRQGEVIPRDLLKNYFKLVGGGAHPTLLEIFAEENSGRRVRGQAKPNDLRDSQREKAVREYYKCLRSGRRREELIDNAQKEFGVSGGTLKRLIKDLGGKYRGAH
jgi:hypothetical protein